MAALTGRNCVLDERDWIGGPRVFGVTIVVEIELPRLRIEDDVLEHRSEAPRRRVDLRLGLGRQSNRFRVASAFEIEYAAIAPPVFVIADEHPLGIARQRRLAGSRQAEEERDVAAGADVCGTMHRQDVLHRQHVVQHAEDRLLHLAGVARAANQHELLGEMNRDDDVRVRAVARRSRFEARHVDDGEFGDVCRRNVRVDEEQASRKQVVPRELVDDADGQAVLRIGAGETILDEELLVAQRAQQIGM